MRFLFLHLFPFRSTRCWVSLPILFLALLALTCPSLLSTVLSITTNLSILYPHYPLIDFHLLLSTRLSRFVAFPLLHFSGRLLLEFNYVLSPHRFFFLFPPLETQDYYLLGQFTITTFFRTHSSCFLFQL
ncbi:hypothetical protein BDW62DRAFT_191012 [Aspergillus aurantiobrunneus]